MSLFSLLSISTTLWLLLGWLLLRWLLFNFCKSYKLKMVETFLLRLLSWVDNFPLSWNFSPKLKIFSLISQHSQLGYLWLPNHHCVAPVWLKGHHVIPFVIKCFPPNPYPGKQRISLGVTSILSICLCLCLV